MGSSINKEAFKYDTAISFLSADENLALQIKRTVENRISCFVFTEEQKRLSGSDGEATLNSVFSKEARIVVILHRDEWAKTKWTRIEETAIRNRGFDEGYDFVVFVPLEASVNPPDWLPKNRIWTRLEPWGIEGLASVIERKIQEYGGIIKEETILDKALASKREVEGHRNREKILRGIEGLHLAQAEFKNIGEGIHQQIQDIKSSISDWHFNIKDNTQHGQDIISYGHTFTFQWYQQASNSLDGSYLMVALWKGVFGDVFSKPEQIFLERLQFDINEFDQRGWCDQNSRRNFRTTSEIVNKYFSELIKRITISRKSESR